MESSQLKEGECYFLLGYLDRDFNFPFIETYVYLGKVSDGKEDLWRFQDAHSYFTRDEQEESTSQTDDDILLADRGGLGTIVDRRGLIDELGSAHQNRQSTKNLST